MCSPARPLTRARFTDRPRRPQIHFRPLHLEEYDDCIEFTTEKGVFVVPIKANIPTMSSKVPTNLDFGFCPVQETETKTFAVTNDGEVDVNFAWSCDPPFTLVPRSGKIAPGHSATITASFSPKDASVFVAHAVCTVPGHTSHVLKVGGIGKYPFLSATMERVDFGPTLTGQTQTQHLKLRNSSLVYARFKIVRTEADVESVFTFAPTSGIIPPDGELTIAVLYAPKVTGTFTSDHYEVRTPGGNTVPIECCGEAIGPTISISKPVVNFNDVEIVLPRKSSSRVLQILNSSDSPVPFQLYGAETNGLFQLSPASGVLLPRQPTYINFTFSPEEPGNYYKRLYVLLLNASPIAVDLIGSGYTDKRRPLPIQPRFVSEYLAREARGLHRMSPEELQQRFDARMAAYERGEPIDDDDDALMSPDINSSELTTSLEPSSEQALMRGLFRGSAWRSGAVHLEEEYVDFGQGSRLRPSEPKVVRLTNRTNGKLAVQWVVPTGYVNGSPKDQKAPVFAMTPSSCDLQPHATATFKLQFRPQSDQQYYVQNLECICAFKSMRTFRLVSDANFALPWCLTLTASGDSFAVGSEQFIPRGILSHRLLTFPAVHVGDASYQTISIKNDNDTPMHFSCSSELSTSFKIVPPVGLVPAGKVQLLAVRFSPVDATRYQKSCSITLNNDPGAALSLMLVGTGCRASIDMPSKLYCPTACVGASSQAKLTMRNPSRLPLAFEWDVPEKLASQLQVDTPSGILRGHETLEVTWNFAPGAERNYLLKVPCLVSAVDEHGDGGASHEVVKQMLTVSAVGSKGVIKAEPEHVEFGTVLVSDVHRRSTTLINTSAVDLYYTLSFSIASRSGDEADGGSVDELISCEQPEGLVPARNTLDIRLVLSPPRRETFEFVVWVTLRPAGASGLGGALSASATGSRGSPPPLQRMSTMAAVELLGPPRELCRVSAISDFPLLQVVDARLHGVSQDLLWQQLRLPEVNTELAGVLSPAEQRILSSEGLASMGDVASMAATLPCMDMMLPPGLPGEPPALLHLLVRNEGLLNASFQLRYPTEMELQIEHWADKGEPTNVELKQHLIVDKEILMVSPRAAELAPGEQMEITVRMRHFRADEYELPILMQVKQGRQIVLNLQGRTLALGEQYLHIPLREIPLPPTPIGLPSAQRHTFELPNYSDVPLPFEVQLSQLHKVNEANFGFPILQCEDPRGVIPPGGVAHVRFRFHPLEAKDYHVALPVAVGDVGVSTFVLLASGYHPKEPRLYGQYLDKQLSLLPPAQQLVPSSQPMRLSFDRALFGQVPSGATVRKLVVLRNTSDTTCDYAWDTAHPLWGTILSVYPSHGTLEPGRHVCLKLSLIAIGPPEELRTSLACTLRPHVDPNAMTSSELAIAEAEASGGGLGLLPPTHPLAAGTMLRPRSPARASVTEIKPKLRGLQALLHIEERESRRQAAAAGLTATEYAQTTALSNRQPSTMPPNAIASAVQGNPGAASTPKLLLDVRACISPPEVLVAGQVDMSTFYLPRAAPPIEAPPLPSLGSNTSAPMRGITEERQPLAPAIAEQRGAVEAIALQMINEILKDPTVTRALQTTERESVPWYTQLAHSNGRTIPDPADAAAEAAMSDARRQGSPTMAAPTLGGAAAVTVPPPPAPPKAVATAAAPPLADVSDADGTGAVAGGRSLEDEALEEARMEEEYRNARAERRAAEVARKKREAAESERVRSATEFQELVAYVLEGTLFNLVSEVSLGEFALDTVPRQIVRSLEITDTVPGAGAAS